MNITIESNIPIPPSVRARSLPLDQVKQGDSFFVAGDDVAALRRVRANVANYAKGRAGTKFVTRTVTEGEVKGVRVWRTA